MSGDLVSVVIPTYNRAHVVGRAIDSALAQTHGALEIIVVDDGSTDGTDALIARRYGAERRVVYVRQANGGVAAARNSGLFRARGDYIALLDSDDIWLPWKIELQLRCLQRFPEAGMIWTDMEAIDLEGRTISPRYLRTMYQNAYRWFPTHESLFARSLPLAEVWPSVPLPTGTERVYFGDLASPIVMGNLVHTSTVLLRRERLEHVKAFNEAYRPAGEDFDFHLRTCRAGPVAYADVSSILYQLGAPDQITSGATMYLARNFLNVIEPLIESGGVDLPASMLTAVRAEAHAWIGKESLAVGDRKDARHHFAASLRHKALPTTALYFALSCGPSFTFPVARRVARAAKKVARRVGYRP